MATRRLHKRKRAVERASAHTRTPGTPVSRRAALFRNGANQAVRLPQELRFPGDVKEVQIRKQGDSLLLSPIKPNWASFFATQIDVSEDFLAHRDQSLPQLREEL